MKKLMIAAFIFAGSISNANVSAPKYCSQEDAVVVMEALKEMTSGFEKETYARGIGFVGGDCVTLKFPRISGHHFG